MTDAPHHATHWDLIAAEAADAVRRREASLDKLAARLGKEAASAELAAWRAIAADWRWVTTHRRTDGVDDVPNADKVSALEQSYARCTAQLRKAQDALPSEVRATITGNTASGLRTIHGDMIEPYLDAWRRRELVDAMLWWQRRTGVESIDFLVRLNIQLRKAARDRASAGQPNQIQGVAA